MPRSTKSPLDALMVDVIRHDARFRPMLESLYGVREDRLVEALARPPGSPGGFLRPIQTHHPDGAVDHQAWTALRTMGLLREGEEPHVVYDAEADEYMTFPRIVFTARPDGGEPATDEIGRRTDDTPQRGIRIGVGIERWVNDSVQREMVLHDHETAALGIGIPVPVVENFPIYRLGGLEYGFPLVARHLQAGVYIDREPESDADLLRSEPRHPDGHTTWITINPGPDSPVRLALEAHDDEPRLRVIHTEGSREYEAERISGGDEIREWVRTTFSRPRRRDRKGRVQRGPRFSDAQREVRRAFGLEDGHEAKGRELTDEVLALAAGRAVPGLAGGNIQHPLAASNINMLLGLKAEAADRIEAVRGRSASMRALGNMLVTSPQQSVMDIASRVHSNALRSMLTDPGQNAVLAGMVHGTTPEIQGAAALIRTSLQENPEDASTALGSLAAAMRAAAREAIQAEIRSEVRRQQAPTAAHIYSAPPGNPGGLMSQVLRLRIELATPKRSSEETPFNAEILPAANLICDLTDVGTGGTAHGRTLGLRATARLIATDHRGRRILATAGPDGEPLGLDRALQQALNGEIELPRGETGLHTSARGRPYMANNRLATQPRLLRAGVAAESQQEVVFVQTDDAGDYIGELVPSHTFTAMTIPGTQATNEDAIGLLRRVPERRTQAGDEAEASERTVEVHHQLRERLPMIDGVRTQYLRDGSWTGPVDDEAAAEMASDGDWRLAVAEDANIDAAELEHLDENGTPAPESELGPSSILAVYRQWQRPRGDDAGGWRYGLVRADASLPASRVNGSFVQLGEDDPIPAPEASGGVGGGIDRGQRQVIVDITQRVQLPETKAAHGANKGFIEPVARRELDLTTAYAEAAEPPAVQGDPAWRRIDLAFSKASALSRGLNDHDLAAALGHAHLCMKEYLAAVVRGETAGPDADAAERAEAGAAIRTMATTMLMAPAHAERHRSGPIDTVSVALNCPVAGSDEEMIDWLINSHAEHSQRWALPWPRTANSHNDQAKLRDAAATVLEAVPERFRYSRAAANMQLTLTHNNAARQASWNPTGRGLIQTRQTESRRLGAAMLRRLQADDEIGDPDGEVERLETAVGVWPRREPADAGTVTLRRFLTTHDIDQLADGRWLRPPEERTTAFDRNGHALRGSWHDPTVFGRENRLEHNDRETAWGALRLAGPTVHPLATAKLAGKSLLSVLTGFSEGTVRALARRDRPVLADDLRWIHGNGRTDPNCFTLAPPEIRGGSGGKGTANSVGGTYLGVALDTPTQPIAGDGPSFLREVLAQMDEALADGTLLEEVRSLTRGLRPAADPALIHPDAKGPQAERYEQQVLDSERAHAREDLLVEIARTPGYRMTDMVAEAVPVLPSVMRAGVMTTTGHVADEIDDLYQSLSAAQTAAERHDAWEELVGTANLVETNPRGRKAGRARNLGRRLMAKWGALATRRKRRPLHSGTVTKRNASGGLLPPGYAAASAHFISRLGVTEAGDGDRTQKGDLWDAVAAAMGVDRGTADWLADGADPATEFGRIVQSCTSNDWATVARNPVIHTGSEEAVTMVLAETLGTETGNHGPEANRWRIQTAMNTDAQKNADHDGDTIQLTVQALLGLPPGLAMLTRLENSAVWGPHLNLRSTGDDRLRAAPPRESMNGLIGLLEDDERWARATATYGVEAADGDSDGAKRRGRFMALLAKAMPEHHALAEAELRPLPAHEAFWTSRPTAGSMIELLGNLDRLRPLRNVSFHREIGSALHFLTVLGWRESWDIDGDTLRAKHAAYHALNALRGGYLGTESRTIAEITAADGGHPGIERWAEAAGVEPEALRNGVNAIAHANSRRNGNREGHTLGAVQFARGLAALEKAELHLWNQALRRALGDATAAEVDGLRTTVEAKIDNGWRELQRLAREWTDSAIFKPRGMLQSVSHMGIGQTASGQILQHIVVYPSVLGAYGPDAAENLGNMITRETTGHAAEAASREALQQIGFAQTVAHASTTQQMVSETSDCGRGQTITTALPEWDATAANAEKRLEAAVNQWRQELPAGAQASELLVETTEGWQPLDREYLRNAIRAERTELTIRTAPVTLPRERFGGLIAGSSESGEARSEFHRRWGATDLPPLAALLGRTVVDELDTPVRDAEGVPQLVDVQLLREWLSGEREDLRVRWPSQCTSATATGANMCQCCGGGTAIDGHGHPPASRDGLDVPQEGITFAVGPLGRNRLQEALTQASEQTVQATLGQGKNDGPAVAAGRIPRNGGFMANHADTVNQALARDGDIGARLRWSQQIDLSEASAGTLPVGKLGPMPTLQCAGRHPTLVEAQLATMQSLRSAQERVIAPDGSDIAGDTHNLVMAMLAVPPTAFPTPNLRPIGTDDTVTPIRTLSEAAAENSRQDDASQGKRPEKKVPALVWPETGLTSEARQAAIDPIAALGELAPPAHIAAARGEAAALAELADTDPDALTATDGAGQEPLRYAHRPEIVKQLAAAGCRLSRSTVRTMADTRARLDGPDAARALQATSVGLSLITADVIAQLTVDHLSEDPAIALRETEAGLTALGEEAEMSIGNRARHRATHRVLDTSLAETVLKLMTEEHEQGRTAEAGDAGVDIDAELGIIRRFIQRQAVARSQAEAHDLLPTHSGEPLGELRGPGPHGRQPTTTLSAATA